jgi:thiamine-triphosphatase
LLLDSALDVTVLDKCDGEAEQPKFPHPTGLVPFAKIETHRSSWMFDGDSEAYGGLTVDLDGTRYGYIVGEVEAVVYKVSDVPLAKDRIHSLVQQITEDQDTSTHIPVGKLEHYLIHNRPKHYKACVEGGSIQDKS